MGISGNTDSLNKWFSEVSEWTSIAEGNLIPAIEKNDKSSFFRWSEKLKQMDPRAWVFFIKKNKNKLSDELKEIAGEISPNNIELF